MTGENARRPAVLAPFLLLGQGRQRSTDEDDLCAATHLSDAGFGNVIPGSGGIRAPSRIGRARMAHPNENLLTHGHQAFSSGDTDTVLSILRRQHHLACRRLNRAFG